MKNKFRLYKKVTDIFVELMICELANNSRKGDRDGWLSCDAIQLVIEIYYHTGKLQEAVKDNEIEKIKEYSADIANMAMMVCDKCVGLLNDDSITGINKHKNTLWTQNIISKNKTT